MSKRFIVSIAAAALLGLVSAQVSEEQRQIDQANWLSKNAQLKSNQVDLDLTEGLCNVVGDFAYFDIDRLVGPYYYEKLINGTVRYFSTRFCGASAFSNTTKLNYTSMVWELDSTLDRTHAIAGSFYTDVNAVRDDNNDITAVKYSSS